MKITKTSLSTMVIFLFLIACSAKTDIEETMIAYLQSHNNHDVEKTLSYFHENASFQMMDQPPILDIRKMEAWDAAIASNLIYESWEVHGDTIIVGTIIERNNWFSHAGIKRIVYRPGTRLIFKEGKIFKITVAAMTEESINDLSDMFNAFFLWASENHPEEMQQLMPGGQFEFSEQKASLWFQLLDEWQQRE